MPKKRVGNGAWDDIMSSLNARPGRSLLESGIEPSEDCRSEKQNGFHSLLDDPWTLCVVQVIRAKKKARQWKFKIDFIRFSRVMILSNDNFAPRAKIKPKRLYVSFETAFTSTVKGLT